MELWFLLAIASTLLWATSSVIAKAAIKNLKPLEYGLIINIIGLMIAIPYSFFVEAPEFPQVLVGWFWLILMEAFLVLGECISTFLFKKEDVSLYTPITSTAPLFTVLIAVTLMLESLTLIQGIAIIFLIIGIYVASIMKKDPLQPIKFMFTSRGIPFLIVAILYGIAYALQKIVLSYINTTAFLIVIYAFSMGFWISMLLRKRKRTLRHMKLISKKTLLITVIASVFSFMQWPPYAVALGMANASLVIPLSYSGILLIVFMGWLVFKEKHVKVRLIGSGVILAGLTLLAL